MKKILSIFMLLVAFTTGAWADKVYSPIWNDNCSTKTSWKTHNTASSVNVTTNNALVADDSYVNFMTANGKDRSNYYDLDGADKNFGTATDYTFEFDLAIYGSNATNHLAHAILKGTDSESVAVDVFSIDCTSGNTFQLNAGTAITAQNIDVTANNKSTRDNIGAATVWYHYTVVSNAADGTSLKVEKWVNGEKTSAVATTKIANGLIHLTELQLNGGSYQQWSIDNLALSVYSENVLYPSASITGVSGISRTVTMTQSQGYDIYYYETDDSYDITGLEAVQYTEPLVINETKYYVIYGKNGANVSDNVNYTFEAGTPIKLNTPVIIRSGNSVTITSDQSDKVCSPSATIYYTYGDGDPVAYSSAITVAADATITAYASATGYTNSDNATRAVALFPTNVVKVINAPQNNTYTTGALSGIDVVGTNATFQALIIDGAQWGGEDVFVQTTGFGFRNGGAGKNWYIDSTSDVWLLVKNLKAGDIIVVSNDYQASNLDNATYTEKYSEGSNRVYMVTADGNVELAFKKVNSGTMHYFYGLYVYRTVTSISGTLPESGIGTLASAYALDFEGTGVEAYVISNIDGSGRAICAPITEAPANTGIILVGEPNAEYSIPVIASAKAPASNLLEAAVTATDIEANTAYILQGGQFHLVNAASTVPAGKAYLPVANVSGARSISLSFGEITGVSEVAAEAKAAAVSKFIKNGQLVIEKNGKVFNANGAQVK